MARGRRLLGESALLILTAVVLAVGLRVTVAEAFRIPSASMEPQLDVGDRVGVSRLAYRLHEPRRGDIVVFPCPPRAGCAPAAEANVAVRALHAVQEAVLLREPQPEEYIKRVIGLPGETVQGKAGSVWIDGHRLDEPYLPPGTVTSTFPPVVVPAGQLWVMGDNRGDSADSRVFGPIRAGSIVGRATARIWPPWRTAFL
jgi:signal peptidase I